MLGVVAWCHCRMLPLPNELDCDFDCSRFFWVKQSPGFLSDIHITDGIWWNAVNSQAFSCSHLIIIKVPFVQSIGGYRWCFNQVLVVCYYRWCHPVTCSGPQTARGAFGRQVSPCLIKGEQPASAGCLWNFRTRSHEDMGWKSRDSIWRLTKLCSHVNSKRNRIHTGQRSKERLQMPCSQLTANLQIFWGYSKL